MSLLWAIPPVAMAAAAAVVLVQLTRMGEVAGALADQLRHLEEVHVAVAEVRAEVATARRHGRALRTR